MPIEWCRILLDPTDPRQLQESLKKLTETQVGGICAAAMRRAGSVSEWNFAGLNEIATGWRTALGACTPPTDKPLAAGEPCMFDLHSMFKLGLGDPLTITGRTIRRAANALDVSVGAIAAGVLAFLVYRRSVKWEMLSNTARRIRLRQ